MQFKLGKHMTPADMMRQEGERAIRKSQRRNVDRELKKFGKDADEKRKKLEGRGAYKPMWDWMDKAEGRKDSSYEKMEEERKHQGAPGDFTYHRAKIDSPKAKALQNKGYKINHTDAHSGYVTFEQKKEGRGGDSDEYLRKLNAMANVRNMSSDERKKAPSVDYREIHKKPLSHFVKEARRLEKLARKGKGPDETTEEKRAKEFWGSGRGGGKKPKPVPKFKNAAAQHKWMEDNIPY